MGKFIIVCVESDVEILDSLYNKISRIVDSDYIVESYVNAEQALIGCYNYIISGNEILITIVGDNKSDMKTDDFVIELHKNSPNTKNILFKEVCNTSCLERIINQSSIYQIIPKRFDRIDFELIVLEAIRQNAIERRLKDYQKVLESAVEKRTKELNDINVKLEILATTDSLSGVKNRRAFFEASAPMIKYTRREGKQLAVLMIDIDKFKTINDVYGHAIGDDVIRLMAQKTESTLRKSDIFGRLGGEEFSAILPSTSQRGALKAAENIRSEIENSEFLSPKNERILFTVSVGVTMLKSSDPDLETILHRADLALYEAKRAGRNKVVMYKDSTEKIN